jgi:Sensors of blue-light using FAD
LIEKIDMDLNSLHLNARKDMLVELLYCSVSVEPRLTKKDLDQILASARRRNVAQDITGMMFYHRGEFVQILEGSKESVANVYKNFICSDPRHAAINKVCENTITHRSFSEWSMGFVGDQEIESRVPISAMGILMNMLSDEAKSKPLSLGLNAFVSIYNQMRKSPYR